MPRKISGDVPDMLKIDVMVEPVFRTKKVIPIRSVPGVVHVVVAGLPAATDHGDDAFVVQAPYFAAPAGMPAIAAFPLLRTIPPVGLNGLAPLVQNTLTPSPMTNDELPMLRFRVIRKMPGC